MATSTSRDPSDKKTQAGISQESRDHPGPASTTEPTDFEKAAEQKPLSLPQEFLLFLKENKKWWLLPIVIVLGLFSLLAIFAGSGAAPFIYTIF